MCSLACSLYLFDSFFNVFFKSVPTASQFSDLVLIYFFNLVLIFFCKFSY